MTTESIRVFICANLRRGFAGVRGMSTDDRTGQEQQLLAA